MDDLLALFPTVEQFTATPRVIAITDLRAWRGQAWRLYPLVSPALRERAGRLNNPLERERRLLAYALHRMVVALALGRDADRVEVGRMASGMPMVAGLPNVATSLSHADDFLAIAVARDVGLVGVDIEAMDRVALLDGLAADVLHAQECAGDEALIDVWVRKEAVLKAIGSGLSIDMNTFLSRQGIAVNGLPAATGLSAWSLRVFAGRARLGFSAATPDGVLVRLDPGTVDVVSLRERVAWI
ncbi:4'-phosphopantetheinyl transferase family protein [Solilutibacter silvestris]|nr:4'-phosphopantetheinyl transferase superfamily protein [Lysobacter silvestris]